MSTYDRVNGPCNCPCHDYPGTLHFMPCCAFTGESRVLGTAKAAMYRITQDALMLGVVGYCPPTRFDEDEARRMIVDAYDRVRKSCPDREIAVVSGLTNVGVLKIAYDEAAKRGWKTVGVACEGAMEHPLFPVTARIVVGANWGDESPTFVGVLDAIVRIGTGKQSVRETEEVKRNGKSAFEYDLPVLSA